MNVLLDRKTSKLPGKFLTISTLVRTPVNLKGTDIEFIWSENEAIVLARYV